MYRIVCDICERPFPTVTRYDDDGDPYEELIYAIGRTAEWKTRDIYPHMCESCAGKIDRVLAKFKNEVTMEALINERNRKLNEERKKMLGTEG